MSSYVAKPLSRARIRKYVSSIRDALGATDMNEFPIMQFLEHVLPQIDPEFNYEIVPVSEMKGRYGLAIPEEHLIQIREDVYEGAVKGVARDRFTIAHEIGHFLMHTPSRVAFARDHHKGSKGKVKPYLDPEWQANTFAAELLAPPNVIKGLTLLEIMSKCKVSKDVAKIQMNCIT